jgi:hypothetical protein
MAALQLRQTAHFGSLFPIAERLETGVPVPTGLLRKYADLASEIVAGGYCRSDIVMAGATVILADLDRQNQSADYDGWASAFERGDRYFRHAVSCTPTNGNYWLRLALIRRAVAERPEELAALMRQSVLVAPAEQDTIIGRFSFWNVAGVASLDASKPSVMSDIKNILMYGNAFLIVPGITPVGRNLAPYFREASPSIPAARLAAFKKAGLDLSSLP